MLCQSLTLSRAFSYKKSGHFLTALDGLCRHTLKHVLKHRLSPTSVGAIAEYSAHPYTAPPFVQMGRIDAFSVTYVVDGPALYGRRCAGRVAGYLPAVQSGQQSPVCSPLRAACDVDTAAEREGGCRLAA